MATERLPMRKVREILRQKWRVRDVGCDNRGFILLHPSQPTSLRSPDGWRTTRVLLRVP